MRYLAEHQTTKLSLTAWAAPHHLSIASHFFWSAGNSIQKSQQGLLQTLLYQALGQFPVLVTKVCPNRWTAEGHKISQPWSLDELVNAFGLLAEQTLGSAKLCFFIDGLDEYEGNLSDLILLVRNLAPSPAIKLCVSSRPWNPFIRAFDNKENNRFRELQAADPQCVEIVADLVQRAQGVFLWVYLVVDSLLRDLDEGDDSRDLRARLESLPTDLEPYFRHMLNTIDPNYRGQTYTIFQSMVRTTHPLPILAFWYLEKEKETPNYALEVQVVPPTGLQATQD
ncbi:hypothetical protein BDZ45DRAFT_708985 [Acephala macrosclerotiorum]|nr:hypothetical protein BDZ45DRAFT_708985 [Acephala macrosclerotiorum]